MTHPKPVSQSCSNDSRPGADSARDADLVARFNGGDESAFLEIMHRHQTRILALTQSLLHNHADAEEITQDTFVRAHRNLAGFRGDSSLATWLHRIAVNLARNRYWYFFRRRRQSTLSLDCPIGIEGDAPLSELVSAENPDPAQAASREEFSDLVAACIADLDAHHREVLVLRNADHLSYEQIAGRLGIHVGTVKSRIARARENLRTRLAQACPEFAPEADPADWFEPARSSGRLTPAWV